MVIRAVRLGHPGANIDVLSFSSTSTLINPFTYYYNLFVCGHVRAATIENDTFMLVCFVLL